MDLDELFLMVSRAEILGAHYDRETLLNVLLETGISRVWCEFAITLANMS